MTPDETKLILDTIRESVKEQIQISVNRKIDKMRQDLLEHAMHDKVVAQAHMDNLERLNDKMDMYIKKDTEDWVRYKEEMEPVVRMGNNLAGFGKTTLYVLGFISAVAGAITLVVSAITKLR